MTDRLDDDLRCVYGSFERDHGRLRAELMAAVDKDEPIRLPADEPARSWRYRIMRSRYVRWSLPAAAAAALVLVVLWPGGNETGRAYAVSDVPGLLKKAKTLHIQGWFFFAEGTKPGQEPKKLPFDYWFDLAGGRMWMRKPGGFHGPNSDEPFFFQTVSDGQYKMKDFFWTPAGGKPEKRVRFTRLTPFQSRLQVHQMAVFVTRLFNNVHRVDGFARTGEETIDGEVFDIWEGEVFGPSRAGMKLKVWLCPTSGNLARVCVWGKQRKEDPRWLPAMDIHSIERDLVPPPDVFKTEAPADCRLENTKETAPLSVLGGESSTGKCLPYALHIHIGFTMHNGTVIVGWSSPDTTEDSQAELFKDLDPGGSLPELPGVIDKLTPYPDKENVIYVGRHLAYTQKDGKFYEWGIYVTKTHAPPRSSLLGYSVGTAYNADKDRFGSWVSKMKEDIAIDSPGQFDTWVRGAMADLSDDGAVPDHVTYENVIALSKRIRTSLP